TTFASTAGVIMYVTDDIPDDVRGRLDAEASASGVSIVYIRRKDDTDLASDAVRGLGIDGAVTELIFFSPKDLEYAHGWRQFKDAIDADRIRQRNSISGELGANGRKVYIKDLCGWAGKVSLQKFA